MNESTTQAQSPRPIPTLLLLGGNGQLGFELRRSLSPIARIVAPPRSELDLTQFDALNAYIQQLQPDLLVNAAAYTAVDKAEHEPEAADQLNHQLPAVLAQATQKQNILLVHYSTDYVFDGQHTEPYTEEHPTNPINQYGVGKRAGEQAIQQINSKHLIFRTSWVLGAYGHNFMRTILKLAATRSALQVVGDQIGAPTTAPLIADLTAHIIQQYLHSKATPEYYPKPQQHPPFPFGLYHLAASGATDWHALATHIVSVAHEQGKQLMLKPEDIQRITTAEYPTPAKRPLNSRLNTQRLSETFGLNLPEWQAGVNYLLKIGL